MKKRKDEMMDLEHAQHQNHLINISLLDSLKINVDKLQTTYFTGNLARAGKRNQVNRSLIDLAK